MVKKQKNEIPEFTFKAVSVGILLGVVFGAANAYLGLRVGMTLSASIPAAVMAVAIFKLFGKTGTILETNISQTIGSASTALATGTIFTIPALFLWGMAPPFFQIAMLCLLGGILGVSAMIPLRRMLIVQAHDELPYPEGTACAHVLKATLAKSNRSHWIFKGMLVGALIKFSTSLFFFSPSEFSALLPFIPKAQIALELAPALLGIGFILGFEQGAISVAGSLLSSLALIPLISVIGDGLTQPLPPETTLLISKMSPDQIWSKYVRYIGAGAIAAAGIITVTAGLPAILSAFTSVLKGLGKKNKITEERTDRDLPSWVVLAGIITVVAVSALVPGIFSGEMSFSARLICAAGVAVFGTMFVAVCARIVGIVGVSSQPISGITLITLLGISSAFVACGWTTMSAGAAVLTVGTLVAIASSKAGDIAQDLKTGFLVGATPARQQFGQLLGASVACWAVAGTMLLLGKAYTYGSKEIPAPQAMLMKTIIEGVLAGNIPWNLVLSGVGITLNGILCGVSGLAFAIGVYLPLASMAPIFIGSCVSRLVLKKTGQTESEAGILAASGLVAGEGLAGVLVAALVAFQWIPKSSDPILMGLWGNVAVLFLTLAVCGFLYYAAMSRKEK